MPQSQSASTKTGPSGLREGLIGSAFRLYKSLLSPVVHSLSPSRCLYLPTCSEYAYTAISRFGLVRGSCMAAARIARCHPWGKGGLDPVPDTAPERLSPAEPCTPHGVCCGSGHKGIDHLP